MIDPLLAPPRVTRSKGDHKRKARPIAPASVTVRDGEITVVVPDVLGKNASHVQSKNGGRRISKQTEAYRESVSLGVGKYFAEAFEAERVAKRLWADDGAWRLEVIGVWPTQNHEVGFVAPRGDADAAIPQALDALQHAGILDDDARVVEVRAWNLYRKDVRATIMRLVRVTAFDVERGGGGRLAVVDGLPERDAAIAHLLPLVPQSPGQPAKPRRARKIKS